MDNHNLIINSISKTYKKGNVKANSNVTVTLKPNEITALIGHNGAGKTTLLNQIVGNVKPDSGDVMYQGVSFVKDTKVARNYISMMPQFHAPLTGVTLKQAIEAILRIRGVPNRLIDLRVNQLMNDLDIDKWSNHSGEKLSGGLQRLTSFAMAVAYPAEIILLDDPTNDVDPVRRKLIWQYIKKLAKEGHIVLVVTHNLLEVEQYADRYVLLDNGRLILDGSPSALNKNLASNMLIVNLNDFYNLQNLPASIESKFSEEEMQMILTLSAEQVPNAVSWVLRLIDEGKVLNYKLTSASLDLTYGGMTDEK